MNFSHSILLLVCIFICTFLSIGCDKDDNSNPVNAGKIVFVSNRDIDDEQGSEIYITNMDGSEITRLTFSPGIDKDPRWNSNGSKIVFTSYRDGQANIYIMNSDGSKQKRITDSLIGGKYPDFSPNDSLIVYFSRNALGGQPGIYIMRENGGAKNLLSQSGNFPDFGPDGNKIVFSQSATIYLDTDIYVINKDGSNKIRLTSASGQDIMPDWSPDGSKIVFVSHRNNEKSVYIMNSDGSNEIPLYTALYPEEPSDPSFSSDGNKIVFSVFNQLHIINIDGSEITTLPGLGVNNNPDWL